MEGEHVHTQEISCKMEGEHAQMWQIPCKMANSRSKPLQTLGKLYQPRNQKKSQTCSKKNPKTISHPFCILAASSLFWVRFSSGWLGGSWASRAWSDPQLIPNFQAQSTPGLLNLARWKRLNDAQHHGTLQKWQLVQQAKKHHNSLLRTVTRNLEPRHRLSER